MGDTNFFEPSEERTICLLFDNYVSEKIAIWVSKELLAAASPVFKAMFYGDFAEKRKYSLAVGLHLPSKNPQDFLTLLKCLSPSADHTEIDETNVLDVFPLAHEYQMELLLEKCVKCFRDGLSRIGIGDESILHNLPFFVKYGVTSLVEHIIPYAAALNMEIIDRYRRENSESLPADHPFYFAVYEAKAHRLSLEQSARMGKQRHVEYSWQELARRELAGQYVAPRATNSICAHRSSCLCGYEFSLESLKL